MGDHGNQDDLTAALAIIQQQMQTQQQQMLQMQQTIQNQQRHAQEAAENAAREERDPLFFEYGDFMTQNTPGTFELIENMASSSLNKNKEHDRSKSVNNIDDLAAKVDQLLKENQSQVFIMEKAAPEKSVGDLAFDA
ncbi:hypothetical protein DY000_02038839 [Brassica cretica]|uniref:Uncharacterized protein n=1 Tax=Brassica cretica TaxID=69181 RepID=A0ABQ7BII2_BRACR|nr:hypothetical protein DY000_02038839 [Brassica cretica]